MTEDTVRSAIVFSAGKDLQRICSVCGKTAEQFVKDAVMEEAKKYMDNDGEVKLKEGVFISGLTPLEKKISENEGHEPEVKALSCFIIRKSRIYCQPYICILLDNRMLSVPAEYIVEDPSVINATTETLLAIYEDNKTRVEKDKNEYLDQMARETEEMYNNELEAVEEEL